MDEPDACLSSQIPHLELQVLERDCLNVEADCCAEEECSRSAVSTENIKNWSDECHTVISKGGGEKKRCCLFCADTQRSSSDNIRQMLCSQTCLNPAPGNTALNTPPC